MNIRASTGRALALMCCMTLLPTGCRKQEEAPPPPPPPKAAGVSIDAGDPAPPAPVAASPAPLAPGAEAPAEAPPNDLLNATEAELVEKVQYAYFSYCREHTAPPKDFSVLVAERYLPAIPVPPAGKKFVIDNKNFKVLLVNQ